jgi:glycopeptide antibiotics resistance protein
MILTLFPFTFSFQELDIDPVVDSDLGMLYDFTANLILFIPVGFSMFGYLIYKNENRFIRSVFIVLVLCSSLSMAIEIIQQLLPSRFPTFSDWILNTISGGFGILLFVLFGKFTIHLLIKVIRLLPQITVHSNIKLLILLLYIPATLYISELLKPDSSFDNWNTQYHLMFGNEFNGGRSWCGQIHRVDIYDGVGLNQNITEEPIFNFNERDLAPQSKVFEWKEANSSRAFINSETQVITTKDKWLCSIEPITSIIEKIQSTDRLNLKIDFTAHSINQLGPARIISISKNSLERNFTIAQDGSNLVIRVRTLFTGENGKNPELVIPNVVQTHQRLNLEIIFDGACLYTKINGKYSPRRLDFNQGVNIACGLFSANAASSRGWGITFSAILCATLGTMLRFTVRGIENSGAKKVILTFIPLGYPLLLLLPSHTHATPTIDILELYFACICATYFTLWLSSKPQSLMIDSQE